MSIQQKLAQLSTMSFHEKQAGPISETLGNMNPLNMYGGGLLGGAGALITPTRTLRQQARHDATDNFVRALGNVFIPGMGPYNGAKRLGASIRSPEMKKLYAERDLRKAQQALGTENSAAQQEPELAPAEENKAAGWKTEALGTFVNPLSVLGAYPGAVLAGVTPTRTLEEQAAANDETWSNILIPGRATYNTYKRMGAVTRSPEMRRMQDDARRDIAEKKLKKLEANPGAAEPPQQKAANIMRSLKNAALNDYVTSPTAQGALMGGAGSALAGGLAGLLAPGHEDTVDEYGNPIRKQRNRFGAALRGALGGGALGAAGGAAAGHFAPGQTTSAFNAMGQYGNQAMDQLKNFGSGMAQQLGFGGKSLGPAPAAEPVSPT